MRFRRTVGERSLRPIRWPGRPGDGFLLRAGLVAALLGVAALVLHQPPDSPPRPGHTPPGSTPLPGRAPSDSRPDPVLTPTPAAPTGSPGDALSPPDRALDGTPPASDRARSDALPLPDGTVGVPVRLAEPAALAVVRPGHRVDLLVAPAHGSATAVLLASRALVLDVVGATALDGTSALYLALAPAQAHRTVSQPAGSRFAIVVRG